MTKEELEKQTMEWKNKLEKEIKDFKEINHELAELCIQRKKRNAELEKENAELKEQLNKDCDSAWYDGFNCSEKVRLEQLTKAENLLNEFMRISKASVEEFEQDYSELIAEAEQFINSEVQK